MTPGKQQNEESVHSKYVHGLQQARELPLLFANLPKSIITALALPVSLQEGT